MRAALTIRLHCFLRFHAQTKMDNKTLTTIVITAIIAAFVKEIVAGLVSLVKKLFANKTITAKLRNALTANKITAVINLGLLAFSIWRLTAAFRDPSPITRGVIFDIAYYFSLIGLSVIRLEILADRYLDQIKRKREERELLAGLLELESRAKRLSESLDESPADKTKVLPESKKEK